MIQWQPENVTAEFARAVEYRRRKRSALSSSSSSSSSLSSSQSQDPHLRYRRDSLYGRRQVVFVSRCTLRLRLQRAKLLTIFFHRKNNSIEVQQIPKKKQSHLNEVNYNLPRQFVTTGNFSIFVWILIAELLCFLECRRKCLNIVFSSSKFAAWPGQKTVAFVFMHY